MAQYFEWFEQGGLQRALLPDCLFHDCVEQPTLLAGGLLEEQLARPTRQAKQVDGLIDGGRDGFLDVLDLAQQPVLLAEPYSRMLIEKLLGDAPVELVRVHRLDARLDLLVPGMQLLDRLLAGGLLGPV